MDPITVKILAPIATSLLAYLIKTKIDGRDTGLRSKKITTSARKKSKSDTQTSHIRLAQQLTQSIEQEAPPLIVELRAKEFLGTYVPYSDIKALTNTHNPLELLTEFGKCRRLVTLQDGKFKFKNPNSYEAKHAWAAHIINFLSYLFFSASGISLLFFSPEIINSTVPYAAFPIALTTIFMVALGIVYIKDSSRISMAHHLVTESLSDLQTGTRHTEHEEKHFDVRKPSKKNIVDSPTLA